MPSALRAVRENVSANRWLTALREAGTGIRRAVGLRVFAEARRLAAEYGQEPTRDTGKVPAHEEMRQWPTNSAEGVLQTVRLFYREKVTGRVIDRFYNVKSPQGLTRQAAVQQAIDANVANAERYQQELIGAFHTGAAVLVPTLVA